MSITTKDNTKVIGDWTSGTVLGRSDLVLETDTMGSTRTGKFMERVFTSGQMETDTKESLLMG